MKSSDSVSVPGLFSVPRLAAIGVHVFTASGVIFALLTLRAIVLADYPWVFFWMGLALVVDSIDGTLARAARVKDVTPNFDGALLDNIIDYLNYVVVPAYLIVDIDLAAIPLLDQYTIAGGTSLVIASVILLASSYQFCRGDAKTADHYFTGFPSYWNLAVFYLYFLDFATTLNFLILALLAVMVFIPIRYVYPSRTAPLFRFTLGLTTLWLGLIVAIAWLYPSPPTWLVWSSLAYVAYYFGLSLVLTVRRRRAMGAEIA